jgi:hypothetical protein
MIAAGVVHDARNSLFAIGALTKALEDGLYEPQEFADIASHIQGQVRRLNEVMAGLLMFGQSIDPSQFVDVDLKEVVS